jgi:hypothetical protein
MSIGGRIWVEDLDRFINTALDDGAELDYNGGDYDDLRDAAWKASDERTALILTGCEVAWGHFDKVEILCRDLRLPYSTHSEACAGAWPEMVKFWEPGCQRADDGDPGISYTCEEDGVPLLSALVIRKKIAAGTLDAELAQMDRIYRFAFPLEIVDDFASCDAAAGPRELGDA